MTPIHLPRAWPRPLIGSGVLVVAILALLALGRAAAPLPFAWDVMLVRAARASAGPAWLQAAAVDVTALGSGVVLTLAVVAAAGMLLVRRLWLAALLLAAACWTGGRAVALVKHAVSRARPELVAHLVPVTSTSFPSAHAANSAIVYLSLAALATQVVRERAARAYILAVAAVLTLLIGASRVYLGVHWPSDVLAGWSFGALWALGWWWIAARTRSAVGGER